MSAERYARRSVATTNTNYKYNEEKYTLDKRLFLLHASNASPTIIAADINDSEAINTTSRSCGANTNRRSPIMEKRILVKSEAIHK